MKLREESRDFAVLPRREQIVEAARAVIEEYGPDALTGQIAERAGLARPNVYRHFASKDELDLEVARSAYEELRAEVLNRLDVGGTALDVIRAPIAVQVAWADNHPNLYRFLVSRARHRGFQQREAELRELAAEVAAGGVRRLPRFAKNRDAAAALVTELGGLVNASIFGWLDQRTETTEQLIDRLALHVWLIVDHHLRSVGVRLDPSAPIPRSRRKRT